VGVGVPTQLLHGTGQTRHHDEGQARFLGGAQDAFVGKPGVGPQQPDADMRRQPLQGGSQKVGRPIGADAVALAQPEVDHQLGFGHRGDQRTVAGFEPLLGVARGHPFLLSVLVQERPRVQIQGIASLGGRQFARRPSVQPGQSVVGGLGKHGEETAQGGLAGNRLDPQHFGHGGITLQPGDPGELVGAAQHTPHKAQGDVGRHIGVGTGRIVR